MEILSAESRFVGFMKGSEDATMKSNLLLLGTSAVGAYAGNKFIKLYANKSVNTLLGIGLGLVAGGFVLKYVK